MAIQGSKPYEPLCRISRPAVLLFYFRFHLLFFSKACDIPLTIGANYSAQERLMELS